MTRATPSPAERRHHTRLNGTGPTRSTVVCRVGYTSFNFERPTSVPRVALYCFVSHRWNAGMSRLHRLSLKLLVVSAAVGCMGHPSGGPFPDVVIYPEHHGEPAWSRTGLIVYHDYGVDCVLSNGFSHWDSLLEGLWTIDPISGNRRQLVRGEWYFPTWSPDGKAVAAQRPYGTSISVIDAATGVARQITHEALSFYPAWSPAGDLIAFSATTGPRGLTELSLIRPDGSDMRTLQGLYLEEPSWGPDARTLVGVGFPGTSREEVLTVDLVTNVVTRLTTSDFGEHRPRFSPNGERIAFSIPTSSTRLLEVWVMNSDGTAPRQLTTGGGWEPSWSPDGAEIVYVRENRTVNAPDTQVLWIVNVATGMQRQLTEKWPNRCADEQGLPGITAVERIR